MAQRFNCADIALLALRRNLPNLLATHVAAINAANAFAEITCPTNGPYTLTAGARAFKIMVNGVAFTGTLTASTYTAAELATAINSGLLNSSSELFSTVATASAYVVGANTRLKIRSKTAAASGGGVSLKIEQAAANDASGVVGWSIGTDSVEEGVDLPRSTNYFWTQHDNNVFREHPGVYLTDDVKESPVTEERNLMVKVTLPLLLTQIGARPLGVLNKARRFKDALASALYADNTLNGEVVHAYLLPGSETGAGEKVGSQYLAGSLLTMEILVQANT